MIERECHRQLLDACKLLLARFEAMREVYRNSPALEDYKFIVRANTAIKASKEAMEIGSSARKDIQRI